jgi:hypothetical protein
MSLLEWTLGVIGIGVSLVGLTFPISLYFNQQRRLKSYILKRGLLWGGVPVFVVYLAGLVTVVDFYPKVTPGGQDRSTLPPNLELVVVFPIPEEFPPGDAPLRKPVTELYLWRNKGGPIYNPVAEIIDEIEASAGQCGNLDSFKKRTILLRNQGHQASILMGQHSESPFFISPQVYNSHFLDYGVYGIEFSRSNFLEPYNNAFEKYLNERGLCGFMRRRSILVKFTYKNLEGKEISLFYRFERTSPFELLNEAQWVEFMSQIPDPGRQSGYALDDLLEPCRILVFVQGGNLLSACKASNPR